jgi:hypothetical protein
VQPDDQLLNKRNLFSISSLHRIKYGRGKASWELRGDLATPYLNLWRSAPVLPPSGSLSWFQRLWTTTRSTEFALILLSSVLQRRGNHARVGIGVWSNTAHSGTSTTCRNSLNRTYSQWRYSCDDLTSCACDPRAAMWPWFNRIISSQRFSVASRLGK